MATLVQEEELCELVHNFPILYDKSHKSYKERYAVANALGRISDPNTPLILLRLFETLFLIYVIFHKSFPQLLSTLFACQISTRQIFCANQIFLLFLLNLKPGKPQWR